MIELDRGMEQYKEIESFEDYELTPCIAYEMAIRKGRDIINAITDYYDNSSPLNMNLEYKKNIDTLMGIGIVYLDLESFSYLDKYSFLHAPKRHHGRMTNKVDMSKKDNFSFLNTETHSSMSKVNNFISTQELKDSPYNDYSKTAPSKVYESKVEPIMKRPELVGTYKTKVELNFGLPKDELIDYISQIKNELDKNRSIIKSPSELLGEELQKADDISRMCTETKNSKEICFDGRKGITRTQKLADMFFIYDAVKQGAKELRIRMALSEYYETIDKKTDMSDKTFRKYRDIAIDYIENERYKELITGTKQ